jgi:hypothetical protein
MNGELSANMLMFVVKCYSLWKWVQITGLKVESMWDWCTYIPELMKLVSWHVYIDKIMFNVR